MIIIAIYKCKMCGGDIHPQEGTKLITCEYCGTTQTVCQIDDSRIANLFNRANEQRMLNEFDKAEALYETIIIENPEESEAYWGKCLCKYGIEYVDDASGRKIPTCHRTTYESIFDDPDYQRAILNADPIAEKQYHNEAKSIDDIQHRILEVASREEPYDVFICYKETNDKGDRTPDSIYAEQIYDSLTEKGLKVFFSRVSLESKLGVDYEPYIFSALHSSRVMIVVGTKYEYFNSVWVKNEWKRYLRLVNVDNNKTIIPCYADMDIKDLPNELKKLQGQDLNKLGALQDIVRGVLKIVSDCGREPASGENIINIERKINKNIAGIFTLLFIVTIVVLSIFIVPLKIQDMKLYRSKKTILIGTWYENLSAISRDDEPIGVIEFYSNKTCYIDGQKYKWKWTKNSGFEVYDGFTMEYHLTFDDYPSEQKIDGQEINIYRLYLLSAEEYKNAKYADDGVVYYRKTLD